MTLAIQRLWEEFTTRDGSDTGFRRAGIHYAFDTSRKRNTYAARAGHARDHDVCMNPAPPDPKDQLTCASWGLAFGANGYSGFVVSL